MSGTGLLLFGLASDMKISQKKEKIVGRCLVQPKAQTSHIVCYCTRLEKKKEKRRKTSEYFSNKHMTCKLEPESSAKEHQIHFALDSSFGPFP
jgi:hypothetical protein